MANRKKTGYCWKCAEEFPMSELIEDDDPYIKDETDPNDKNYQCHPCAAKDEEGFCGCCGRECQEREIWCDVCKLHVGHKGALHDRTYFARTGASCPNQNQAKNFGPG